MFSISKVLSGATRKTSNRLAEALRLAAFGLKRAKCRLGDSCRRMEGRLGKAEGVTATAHQLARVIYAMIANGRGYDEAEAFRKNPGVEQKRQKKLRNDAGKLGFQLVPIQQVTTRPFQPLPRINTEPLPPFLVPPFPTSVPVPIWPSTVTGVPAPVNSPAMPTGDAITVQEAENIARVLGGALIVTGTVGVIVGGTASAPI